MMHVKSSNMLVYTVKNLMYYWLTSVNPLVGTEVVTHSEGFTTPILLTPADG